MPQAATASDLDFSSQGELVPELLDFSDQGELVSPTVQPTAPPQPEATIGPDTSFRARHPTLSKLRDNPLTDFLIGPDPAGPDMTQLQAESGRGGGVFSPDPNIHPIPIITAPPETGKIGQVAAAIKNIPANLVNSIAGNPLPFAIPGGKLLSLVFGLQMASEVPSEYRNAKKVVDDPKATLQEKIEAVAAVPATATMAGLSLAHAASGLRSTRPSPPSDTGAAEQSAKLEELASKSRGIDQAREQAAAAARQAPGPQIAQPGLPLQATAPPEFQPSAPAIPIKKPPVQKIPPTTLRQQEADAQRAQKMATEPSGLSMAVDKAKQAQWGDIPANDQMLAMLPQDRPSLQPPVGPTSPESVPQGGASQAVRQAGEAVQRAQDYPKAAAEKVSQEQVPPVHPDKPLTGNQLTIIQDSLRKAITDNQIPGERKGFIAGSGLEKWADGVLHDHSWLKQANADLGLKLTTESAKRVAALAVKGTALIERGVTDFARWSAEMVKEHGEDIKPWLKKIYQQSVSIRAGAFSQPETQEVQNARSQQETAAVHGNVQPQQPPGSGLPAQERGGGIQSQAAGGIQEGGEAPPSGAPPVSVRGGALNPDEVRAKYPDAFKGSTARDIPVEIKLSDGTVVPGVMNGYQGTPDGPRPSVAKLKNDGQPGSHGMLGPGEEIVSQTPTQEQLDAGKAAQRRVDEIQRVSAEPATSFTGKDRSGLAAIEFGKKATTPHEVEALRKAEAAAKAEVDQAKGVARLIPKKKQQFFTEALREAEKQTTVTKTALPQPVGMGGAKYGEVEGKGNPDVYGVAERVRDERAKAGQVAPVEPGQGISAPDSVDRGRQLLTSGTDPEQVMADFEKTKALSSDAMAVARAQGEKLTQDARQIEQQYGTDSPEYRAAFKALSDWDARSKTMQTEWHKTGKAQQGETDLDTGSFTGLQRSYKEDTGKEFTEPQKRAAKKVAAKSKEATDKAQEAEGKLRTFLKNVEPAPEENTLWGKVKGALTDQKKTEIVWKRIKDYIAQGHDDYKEVVNKVATDLGLKFEEVAEIMARNQTTKRLADDVWAKQKTARDMKEMAKRWLRNQTIPGWQKALERIPRAFFTAKTNFHGTVALGTHAPMVFYQPKYWAEYVRNFAKMYKMVGSPAYHEMQMQALLHDPNWEVARRAGLVNDPHTYEDFNNPEMATQLGSLTGMGNRGYTVLKTLRQDMFNHQWDRLPDTQKTPEFAEKIAESVNHVTGVVKSSPGKGWNLAFFAPRLEMSRAAWLVGDPVKAMMTAGNWKNATEAEKYFAVHQFREKATVAATMFGMLAVNQGILAAMGSKQKINGVPQWMGGKGFDPMASDFLKFKAAGQTLSYGNPFITMARLPIRLGVLRFKGGTGKLAKLIYPNENMYKTVGEYARTQESPLAAFLTDLATKGDYENRPLPKMPFSGPQLRMPKRLAARGIKPYTWPEFLLEQALPIPIEESLKDVWKNGFGMSGEQIKSYGDGFIKAMLMAGTGGRMQDDWDVKKK